ncbi:hypothetical protein FF1_023276 [Malus domestica]
MSSPTKQDQQSSVKRVAVVGGGVSGLAAAYKLKSHGFDVAVFEAEGRAGGNLRSVSRDDLIWDEGANLMTESETEVQTLLDNLGLREKQQFEKSGQTKGSVEKGKRQRGSFSFHGGMQTLTDTLCNQLGKDELKLNSKVLSLSYSHDGKSAFENWSVSSAAKDDKHSQSLSVDAVVMTAPLCNVKEMNITKRGTLFPLDFFPEVTYVPVSVIITTFKKEDVKRPLEGFGVLVPSKEQKNGLKTLGTLFSSMMFPDRAPSGLHLYTTFVGGSQNKELAKASTDELKKIVTSDIRHWLGAEGEPTSVNHYHWSKACPLYGHNYDSVIEAIEKMEKNLPGFFYAGNHRGGLSVDNAIASGCKAAELVIAYLESPPDEKTRQE